MSTVSKWVMALIVAAVILDLLRHPAASVGITIAGGEELKGILGTLGGSGDKPQKGSFNIGTNKIALG